MLMTNGLQNFPKKAVAPVPESQCSFLSLKMASPVNQNPVLASGRLAPRAWASAAAHCEVFSSPSPVKNEPLRPSLK
jgi:hypothetical protein